jgi:hypothetical protein
MEMQPNFTNFDRWEAEQTAFIKATSGMPRPQANPLQLKNQKLSELLDYVSANTKVDRSYLVSELTKVLLIGQ